MFDEEEIALSHSLHLRSGNVSYAPSRFVPRPVSIIYAEPLPFYLYVRAFVSYQAECCYLTLGAYKRYYTAKHKAYWKVNYQYLLQL